MGFFAFEKHRSERDFQVEYAEAVEEVKEDSKRRSAQTSKKAHKRKVFYKGDKPVVKDSPLLGRLLQPVVDPGKPKRDAELLKNPFRGLRR